MDLNQFLAQFDQSFEAAEVSAGSGDWDLLPDGKYKARIEKAEFYQSKKNLPFFKWELVIIGPTHANRKLWKYERIATDKMNFLKSDLHLCGVKIEKLTELPRFIDNLKNILLNISLKTTEDEQKNKYQNIWFNSKVDALASKAQGATTTGFDTVGEGGPPLYQPEPTLDNVPPLGQPAAQAPAALTRSQQAIQDSPSNQQCLQSPAEEMFEMPANGDDIPF